MGRGTDAWASGEGCRGRAAREGSGGSETGGRRIGGEEREDGAMGGTRETGNNDARGAASEGGGAGPRRRFGRGRSQGSRTDGSSGCRDAVISVHLRPIPDPSGPYTTTFPFIPVPITV